MYMYQKNNVHYCIYSVEYCSKFVIRIIIILFCFFSPQDDYMEALGKLHMTVTRAYKVGLKIELHNFMTIVYYSLYP